MNRHQQSTQSSAPGSKKPEIDLTNPSRTDSREAEMGQRGAREDKGTQGPKVNPGKKPGTEPATPEKQPSAGKNSGVPVPAKAPDRGIDAAVGDGTSQASTATPPTEFD